MSHGEGWQFIQIGRFIERATAISTLLDVHFSASARGGNGDTPQTEHFEWIGLLKGCTAFEAFCKVYTADLSPTRIAEFLLLNPEFPHSIRFSIDRLYEALTAIAAASPARRPDPVDRLTGRLRSSLSYTPIEEVLGPNFHAYLEDIQRQCNQIHSAVHRVYISYPIQSTIDA
jgi:uncharacterized alpha-E superfamily protein